MKILRLMVVGIFSVFCATGVYAAYNGNPSQVNQTACYQDVCWGAACVSGNSVQKS